MHSKTFIEVHLGNIIHNYQAIQGICAADIYAVVKANAYGLGLIPVVKALQQAGAQRYAINEISEAEAIRHLSTDSEILRLCPSTEAEIPRLLSARITATVTNFQQAERLNRHARAQKRKIPIQLKINTGMNRFGIEHDQAIHCIHKIHKLPHTTLTGIWSHFADAEDSDSDYTWEQLQRFRKIQAQCQEANLRLTQHIANSAGLTRFKETHYNAVRPGLMLYGCHPSALSQRVITLKKVIQVKSRILEIKEIPPHTYISYKRRYRSTRAMRIGIIGIGYADGYSSLLSNKGKAEIHGQVTQILGQICMESLTIDLSHIPQAQIDDEVTFIGASITEEKLAKELCTSPYEILTSLTKAIPRKYISHAY